MRIQRQPMNTLLGQMPLNSRTHLPFSHRHMFCLSGRATLYRVFCVLYRRQTTDDTGLRKRFAVHVQRYSINATLHPHCSFQNMLVCFCQADAALLDGQSLCCFKTSLQLDVRSTVMLIYKVAITSAKIEVGKGRNPFRSLPDQAAAISVRQQY